METTKSQAPQNSPESRLHFLDYWRIIRIRKLVILAVFLLVVLTTTAVTFILPESYMSMVRIAVDKDSTDINPLGFAHTSQQFDPYFIQTEFEKIKSKTVLYKVIEDLKLNKEWGDRYNDGTPLKTTETYGLLTKQVDVRQTRNTSLIEIRVYSDDKADAANEAARIANHIAKVYRESRLSLMLKMSDRGLGVLTNELAGQDIRVRELQTNADNLRRDFQISDFVAEGSGIVSTIEPETVRQLERERITLEATQMGNVELLNKLQELQRKGPSALRQAILTILPDADLGKLLQDLWATEATLAKMNMTLGAQHPEMVSLAAMQADLDRKASDKIEGMMAGLDARVAATRAQLDTLKEAVDAAKRRDAEMTAKYRPYFIAKRDLESQQKIRDAIYLRTLQESVDAKLPKTAIVEIVDEAEPGLRPVRPNHKLNIALGVVVGLIVGVGLAFFIEYLDTSVKTIDDVERSLQAAVLGVIPQNVGPLMNEGPDSPHAEAYRVLRTNVMFSRKRDDANAITIVSGGAGEGKSTTIFNLATVFAQNGQRVLLVDSDLRRPSLHKIMKVSNSLGLTNYLLGQNTLEQVVQTTKLPNFDFLPSGKLPSSSMGILNSAQMKEFITEVKRRYDFVFFDSPPIMGVSDASILASMVDMTLLVVQYRKYPQAMTVRAKQMVEKVGGTLLGVVLNNINISQDSYYYYYSGYYYDYYSKHEDQEPGAKGRNRNNEPARTGASAGRAEAEIKPKY